MENRYNKNFFPQTGYTERLHQINREIIQDRYDLALYIKRAELHLEFSNERSALSDLLLAEQFNKNNTKVLHLLSIIYANQGDNLKANLYKAKIAELEQKLQHQSKASINNLINK